LTINRSQFIFISETKYLYNIIDYLGYYIMLQNDEKKLKYLIKRLITENIVIKDVIDNFEEDFEDADFEKDPDEAKKAIRKNNALLEIILNLLDHESDKFKGFYKKSGFTIDDVDFIESQEKKREKDKERIFKWIKDFTNSLQHSREVEGFKTALSTLKRNLGGYAPAWYPLQYLFISINESDRFDNYLNELSKNDNLWQFIKEKPGIQILKKDSLKIEEIINKINSEGLTSQEKSEILKDKVTSKSFLGGVKKNDWSFITDFIDDTVGFFFPGVKISDELETWFGDLQKAFGKDPDKPWLEEMLLEDPDFKKLVDDAKNGKKIKKETLEKVTDNIEKESKKIPEVE